MSRMPAKPSGYDNQYTADNDALLAANPPEIQWRKNNHGILVAVSVDETPRSSGRRQRPRTPESSRRPSCRRGHQLTPDNVEVTRAGYRRCLTCKANGQRERTSAKAAVSEALRDSMQIEAIEVAERFRQHRADNTSLMQAVRREI